MHEQTRNQLRRPWWKVPRPNWNYTAKGEKMTYDHIQVKPILLTTSRDGFSLLTMELTYPRFIHAEVMTHRALAKNASSSRAIPSLHFIEQAENNPVLPLRFGQNQKGMQDTGDCILNEAQAIEDWRRLARDVAGQCRAYRESGVHKQIANRPLEPYTNIKVVVTGNIGIEGYGWDWFFSLRDHEDAQPEIKDLAQKIKASLKSIKAVESDMHFPYVTDAELESPLGHRHLMLISAARCARVSYFKMEPKSVKEELELANLLLESKHLSPFDHQGLVCPIYQIDKLSRTELVALVTKFVTGKDLGTDKRFDVRHLRGWYPARVALFK